jgi:hypothetical protein
MESRSRVSSFSLKDILSIGMRVGNCMPHAEKERERLYVDQLAVFKRRAPVDIQS